MARPGSASQLPLFPLRTVLFPGGLLPLRVFEQRYIEMTKRCVRDGAPFGVCAIRSGEEVAGRSGGAPEFEQVGTLARITGWDMQQLGIFQLATRGEGRFRVVRHRVASDGLVVGEIEPIPDEPALPLPGARRGLAEFLARLIERVGAERFPSPARLDDATWVGYRIAELLPLPLGARQGLLELSDAEARLTLLDTVLRRNALL